MQLKSWSKGRSWDSWKGRKNFWFHFVRAIIHSFDYPFFHAFILFIHIMILFILSSIHFLWNHNLHIYLFVLYSISHFSILIHNFSLIHLLLFFNFIPYSFIYSLDLIAGFIGWLVEQCTDIAKVMGLIPEILEPKILLVHPFFINNCIDCSYFIVTTIFHWFHILFLLFIYNFYCWLNILFRLVFYTWAPDKGNWATMPHIRH